VTGFRAPTGTRDVLAPESARVEAVVRRFSEISRLAGYGLIITPTFEDAGVFRRGVGEESEVVTKEMYEFDDKGGRHMALRPEGTASVVRAFLQHRPQLPYKAWYSSPAFRYERPQAGRFREHHQLGVEVLGTDDPDLDVEVIALLAEFLGDLGLSQVTLRLNSLGDDTCRPPYRELLLGHLRDHEDELCDEHRTSFEKSPLRILDCKRPACVAVAATAPRLLEHLCGPCTVAFERVKRGLGALGVDYVLDPMLVRGLDYYTRTAFEFASGALDSAQNAVGGGGRYDGLAAALGGPDTPGIGFACGVERILLAQDAEGVPVTDPAVEVFVVDLAGGEAARDLTALLRRGGISCERAFDNRSMRAQLRIADRSGARLAVIVGAEEEAEGTATLRELRVEGERHQEKVARDGLVERVKELL